MEHSEKIKRNRTTPENFDNCILAQVLTNIILVLEKSMGTSL